MTKNPPTYNQQWSSSFSQTKPQQPASSSQYQSRRRLKRLFMVYCRRDSSLSRTCASSRHTSSLRSCCWLHSQRGPTNASAKYLPIFELPNDTKSPAALTTLTARDKSNNSLCHRCLSLTLRATTPPLSPSLPRPPRPRSPSTLTPASPPHRTSRACSAPARSRLSRTSARACR